MIDISKDKLITLTEVGKLIKKSTGKGRPYNQIKSWVDAGELEAVKIGGSWHTTVEALNAYLHRETPEPASGNDSRPVKQTKTEFRNGQEIKRAQLNSLLNQNK